MRDSGDQNVMSCMDGDTPKDRLDVLHPVIEDLHALRCFLKVATLSEVDKVSLFN